MCPCFYPRRGFIYCTVTILRCLLDVYYHAGPESKFLRPICYILLLIHLIHWCLFICCLSSFGWHKMLDGRESAMSEVLFWKFICLDLQLPVCSFIVLEGSVEICSEQSSKARHSPYSFLFVHDKPWVGKLPRFGVLLNLLKARQYAAWTAPEPKDEHGHLPGLT